MNPEESFTEIAQLDRLIHDPTRLAILTALSACDEADFLFLQRLIGLTKGNMSGHLSKLNKAELVEINKSFVNKRPRTRIALTEKGKLAINNHWLQLDQLRDGAAQWQKQYVEEGA